MQAVQFAVNYVPQYFYANDPYSVLSRFIIMVCPLLQNVMTHRYSVENPIGPDPCCHFEPQFLWNLYESLHESDNNSTYLINYLMYC